MYKTNRWIIGLDGSYLDTPSGKLTGFSDNTEEIIVIAPFDTASAVSFGVGNEHRTALSQYLSLDVDGVVSDWVDEDWTSGTVTYQDIADWNVWRIGLKATTKAYISKYRGGFVYFSFRFGNIVTNDKTVTYKGTFGVDNLLPTEDQTTGDYYALEDLYYTLTVDTNGKTLVLGKGMYVYWGSGGYWVKVSENLVQNTCSQTQAVDPSFAINDEVDEDEINYLVSFESTIADHETRIQELEETGGTTAVGISYNGEGTNYLETKENVQSAVTELDTQLKATNDSVEENATAIEENTTAIEENTTAIEENTESITSNNQDLQLKIIELKKENKALSKQVASLNPSNEGVISTTVSEFVEHFNAKAAKLPLKIADIKGLKIEQLVENGDDFASGWTLNNATGSVTDGIYSFTATSTNGSLRQGSIQRYLNNQYVLLASVKSSNSGIKFGSGGAPISGGTEHSGSGNYEIIKALFTAPSDNSNWIIDILDTNTSAWTQIDVDYVMCIPITNTPYATETADEWALRVPKYLTQGEHWIINPSFEMVGKNLFDKENINQLEAYFGATITNNSATRTLYVKIKPNNTYTVSRTVLGERFSVGFTKEIPEIGSVVYSSASGNTTTDLTVTDTNDCNYLVIYYYHFSFDANYTAEEIANSIQVESNDTATDNEAFNSNKVSVLRKDGEDLNMRSVGTAQDGIVYKNGIPFKNENVGRDYNDAIKYADTTLVTAGTTYNRFRLTDTLSSLLDNVIDVAISVAINASLKIGDDIYSSLSWDDASSSVYEDYGLSISYRTGNDYLYIISSYATAAELEAYLQANDVTLDYELATADTSKELEIVGDKPISQPYFTFRQIQTLSDAGIYDNGISIQLTANPISELTYLATIDYESGFETELDVSTAVISGDGLSFTHPDLSDGDFVSFTYDRTNHNIATDIDLEYYNADEVIEDSVTGTVYKTSISAADGVPSIELTEV